MEKVPYEPREKGSFVRVIEAFHCEIFGLYLALRSETISIFQRDNYRRFKKLLQMVYCSVKLTIWPWTWYFFSLRLLRLNFPRWRGSLLFSKWQCMIDLQYPFSSRSPGKTSARFKILAQTKLIDKIWLEKVFFKLRKFSLPKKEKGKMMVLGVLFKQKNLFGRWLFPVNMGLKLGAWKSKVP